MLESERKQKKQLEDELRVTKKAIEAKGSPTKVSAKYDSQKNRIYVTMQGDLSVQDAERLKREYEDVLAQCKTGFDVLTLAEGLAPFKMDVQRVLTDICKLVSKFGVRRVARMGGETPQGAMQLNLLSRSAGGYVATNFKTVEEAEGFLDA